MYNTVGCRVATNEVSEDHVRTHYLSIELVRIFDPGDGERDDERQDFRQASIMVTDQCSNQLGNRLGGGLRQANGHRNVS